MSVPMDSPIYLHDHCSKHFVNLERVPWFEDIWSMFLHFHLGVSRNFGVSYAQTHIDIHIWRNLNIYLEYKVQGSVDKSLTEIVDIQLVASLGPTSSDLWSQICGCATRASTSWGWVTGMYSEACGTTLEGCLSTSSRAESWDKSSSTMWKTWFQLVRSLQ